MDNNIIETDDPDSNAFLSWIRKLYDSIFFFGLAPAPKKKNISSRRRMRPSKSPFFTSAEQLGQLAIRQEMSVGTSDRERSVFYGRSREDLLEALADMKEELDVVNITLEAAGRDDKSDPLSSRYKANVAKRGRLLNDIEEIEIELQKLTS
jgi:hypothetical protein